MKKVRHVHFLISPQMPPEAQFRSTYQRKEYQKRSQRNKEERIRQYKISRHFVYAPDREHSLTLQGKYHCTPDLLPILFVQICLVCDEKLGGLILGLRRIHNPSFATKTIQNMRISDSAKTLLRLPESAGASCIG